MKKLLFFLALLIAAYLVWRWWHSDASTARGQELFYDRVWIDHVPTSETDPIDVFIAVTEQPLGVFQSSSKWRGSFELFGWRGGGDGKVDLTFPQTRTRESARYRAWRCKEARFEYCLQIDGASRGVKRYYSQEGWEVGGHSLEAAQKDVARLVH